MASNRGSPTSGSLRYAKRAICCNVSAFWSTKLSKVDILSFVKILLISQRSYKWIILCWFHINLQNSLKNTSKNKNLHLKCSGNTLQKAYVCRREKLIWCFICKVCIGSKFIEWHKYLSLSNLNAKYIRKLVMKYHKEKCMLSYLDFFAMLFDLYLKQNLN